MKKNIVLSAFCTASFLAVCAQLPYQTVKYQIRKDSAVYVGTSPNYCGNPFDIKINMYKPVGDNNRYRPIAIFTHGGGFTSAEDFNEYQMNMFAQEFAKRGYATASIDYREGHHLQAYGAGLPYPVGLGIFAAWQGNTFISDSAEAIRSIYRAQQDLKAVIRFMKLRTAQDSTDACKVFIGGHSAGAITTLSAAFMDNAVEKPSLAGAINTLPNPQWQNTFLQINGPQGKDDAAYRQHNPGIFNFDAAACYLRPDLGDINGSLNTAPDVDANVLGIMSLAGAIVDTNNISVPNNPAMFLYHIPGDQVVDYNAAKPFTYLNSLLYPAPNGNWPVLYGSNWLNGKLNRVNYPTVKKFWSYDNGGNPFTSHDILPGPSIVADTVAKFFAQFLDTCQKCTAQDTTLNFRAEKVNQTSLLKWQTILHSKINFVLAQRSANNSSYDSIGKVTVANNTLSYQFTDNSPVLKGSYYRLKMIFKNGTVKYSTVKFLQFVFIDKLSLYPKPVGKNGQATVLFPPDALSKKATLQIFDALGRKVFEKNYTSSPATETVNCSSLQKGFFILKLILENGTQQLQFIK
jgi:pimeloyl-ACP methyl ester carboxylesterase